MTKPFSVAIKAAVGDIHNIGTGFFVTRGRRSWFVTAAHVPTRRHPDLNFSTWPRTLGLLDPQTRTLIELPMFNILGQNHFNAITNQDGVMADMMSFDTSLFPDLDRLKSNYRTYKLDVITTPTVGDDIIGHGYPMDDGEFWPPKEKTTTGKMLGIPGIMEVGMPVQNGFSGGPALKGNELVGLIIGKPTDDGPAHLITAQNLLLVLK